MVHIQYKYCPRCKEDKPRDEYYSDKRSASGLRSWCKSCESTWQTENRDPEKTRERNLRRRYDMTWDMWLDMLADQHGKCPICKDELDLDPECHRSKRAPVVDHDHDTGRVRAILCADCNRALGLFKDNPDICWAAARYVIEHNAEVIYVSREDSGD